MADLADIQGILSQSSGSVSHEAGPAPKRTKLRMGDLSPAKCINPMGVRRLGVGSRVPFVCASGWAMWCCSIVHAGRCAMASWGRGMTVGLSEARVCRAV
eukprot:10624170-Alexandrium_andersonii.AAC.1